jgi:hypothetical protein
MDKQESLQQIKELHRQEWESDEDIPYADSIYKMIDTVIEHELDTASDAQIEDFYRYHMRKHYEDKRNAVEFNDAWVNYRSMTRNHGR